MWPSQKTDLRALQPSSLLARCFKKDLFATHHRGFVINARALTKFALLAAYRAVMHERKVLRMTRSLPRALFAAFSLTAVVSVIGSSPASAQGQTTYDVKTINFDLWCQEQAKLPPERCDKRTPEDESQYEAFRDKVEKYEIPYLQDKQRTAEFNDNILNHDPVDNPPDPTKSPQTPQTTPRD